VHGTEKGGLHIGREYKRGVASVQVNRKKGWIVTLTVGKKEVGAQDCATRSRRNKPDKQSSPSDKDRLG
jgi:hypothetical protein